MECGGHRRVEFLLAVPTQSHRNAGASSAKAAQPFVAEDIVWENIGDGVFCSETWNLVFPVLGVPSKHAWVGLEGWPDHGTKIPTGLLYQF